MERVRFNKCLNLESKAWNLPMLGLYGAGIFALLGMLIKGAIGLVFGCAIGFGFGRYVSHQHQRGDLQRWAYWNLSIAKQSKKMPPSFQRHLH